MDEDLKYPDIVQQYQNNVVLYKGKPVIVGAVGVEYPHKVSITYLMGGKRESVEFNLKDFSSPAVRLGMVNIRGSIVWTSRRPHRKMAIGINKNNLVVDAIRTEYPEGAAIAVSDVQALKCQELGRTMIGKFPSFDECLDYIKNFKGAMAFDRQFAIDCNRQILYKNFGVVGNLPKNCSRPERIQFLKGNEHLEILIGDNCEKTLSAIGA